MLKKQQDKLSYIHVSSSCYCSFQPNLLPVLLNELQVLGNMVYLGSASITYQ